MINKTKDQRKIENIFLSIILAYVLGAQKNRLSETVLLSTYNICWVIRKVFFFSALLTKVLTNVGAQLAADKNNVIKDAKCVAYLCTFLLERIISWRIDSLLLIPMIFRKVHSLLLKTNIIEMCSLLLKGKVSDFAEMNMS